MEKHVGDPSFAVCFVHSYKSVDDMTKKIHHLQSVLFTLKVCLPFQLQVLSFQVYAKLKANI